MLIAGLTGGMACGKSFVARALAEMGCHAIEADEIGRELMQPGEKTFDEIAAAFGSEILTAGGLIDRPKLAARVFSNASDLERLNAIVHPAVAERAREKMRRIGENDAHAIVIYVAAILIESGNYRNADKIVVVTCTRAQQIERALERSGAIESEILARLDRQMPLEEKCKYADYIIDTTGAKEETLRQTRVVYEDLRRLA